MIATTQVIIWLLVLPSVICGFQTEEQNIELALCNLLKHTPLFVIYKLYDKSNCYSHAKSIGKLVCLQNGENKVKQVLFLNQNN